jgi:hypothetical protein
MKSEECIGGLWLADQRGAFIKPLRQYESNIVIARVDRNLARKNKLSPPLRKDSAIGQDNARNSN